MRQHTCLSCEVFLCLFPLRVVDLHVHIRFISFVSRCCFCREFATRLFSFLRFTIAGHEIRTSLWQALLPPGAVATAAAATAEGSNGAAKKVEKLSFEQLGRKFELNAGSIRAAIASAVSEAAMRPGTDKSGTMHAN